MALRPGVPRDRERDLAVHDGAAVRVSGGLHAVAGLPVLRVGGPLLSRPIAGRALQAGGVCARAGNRAKPNSATRAAVTTKMDLHQAKNCAMRFLILNKAKNS